MNIRIAEYKIIQLKAIYGGRFLKHFKKYVQFLNIFDRQPIKSNNHNYWMLKITHRSSKHFFPIILLFFMRYNPFISERINLLLAFWLTIYFSPYKPHKMVYP